VFFQDPDSSVPCLLIYLLHTILWFIPLLHSLIILIPGGMYEERNVRLDTINTVLQYDREPSLQEVCEIENNTTVIFNVIHIIALSTTSLFPLALDIFLENGLPLFAGTVIWGIGRATAWSYRGRRIISRDTFIGVCGRHLRSKCERYVADRRRLFRAFWGLAGKQAETGARPCCLGVQYDRDAWRMAWGPRASTGSGNLGPLSFRKFVAMYQCMDVLEKNMRSRFPEPVDARGPQAMRQASLSY